MNRRIHIQSSPSAMWRFVSTLAIVLAAQNIASVGRALAQEAKSAKDFPGNEFVKVRLALEKTAIAPNATTNLAVIFDIAPGWHLYWRNPGDSGLPPQVKFKQFAVVSFGDPQWPVPMRHIEADVMVDYIYERQLVLIFPISVSAVAAGKDLTISAEIDWLVCKERCVPGRVEISNTWRVATDGKPSTDAKIFTDARTQHPKGAAAGEQAYESSWDGMTLTLRAKGANKIAFFPHENDENIYPDDMVTAGEAKADWLRLRYGDDVLTLKQVSGLLVATRGKEQTAYEISVAPPKATKPQNSN